MNELNETESNHIEQSHPNKSISHLPKRKQNNRNKNKKFIYLIFFLFLQLDHYYLNLDFNII